MTNYIPVEGNSDLVRDPRTDQIINTNTSAYEQYVSRRKQRKLEKEKSLTIEEVLNHFSDSINKVTIYRALEGFELKGLVHKVPDRNNLIRYSLCKEAECDINSHDHQHGHFICKRCDDTFCLEEIKFTEDSNLKGFYVEESNVVLQGYCQACYID